MKLPRRRAASRSTSRSARSRANKARGALTTLGIVIGIVAVVTTMTAVNGLQNRFRESLSAVGTDVLYVSRMPWVVMNDFFLYRNRPRLDLREARALEARLRGRALVNPTLSTQRGREVRRRDDRGRHDHRHDREADPVLGGPARDRALPDAVRRVLQAARVRDRQRHPGRAVPRQSIPLHKTLKIGRVDFQVIGVMEKQGGSFLGGPNFDRQIFIPITTYEKVFGEHAGEMDVNIAVKAPSPEAMRRPRVRGHRRDAQAPRAASDRARQLLDQQARHAASARSTT